MGKSSQKPVLDREEVNRVDEEFSSGEQIASSSSGCSRSEELDNERRVEESNPQPSETPAKKQRKKTSRGSHNLKKFCYVVTRHSERGRPESPERAQKAFATTCGALHASIARSPTSGVTSLKSLETRASRTLLGGSKSPTSGKEIPSGSQHSSPQWTC